MDGYFDEEDDFLATNDGFPYWKNVQFVGKRNVGFAEKDDQFDELDCRLVLHEALGTELFEQQNETVLEHCWMMEGHWKAWFSLSL